MLGGVPCWATRLPMMHGQAGRQAGFPLLPFCWEWPALLGLPPPHSTHLFPRPAPPQHGGANPNVANYKGATPLHVAASDGRATVLAALISGGADVNARDGKVCQ